MGVRLTLHAACGAYPVHAVHDTNAGLALCAGSRAGLGLQTVPECRSQFGTGALCPPSTPYGAQAADWGWCLLHAVRWAESCLQHRVPVWDSHHMRHCTDLARPRALAPVLVPIGPTDWPHASKLALRASPVQVPHAGSTRELQMSAGRHCMQHAGLAQGAHCISRLLWADPVGWLHFVGLISGSELASRPAPCPSFSQQDWINWTPLV